MAFISADSNHWLWNKIKIALFTIFVIGGEVGDDVKFWMFAVGGGTKIKQVQARVEEGSKFWSFYENVKIECP